MSLLTCTFEIHSVACLVLPKIVLVPSEAIPTSIRNWTVQNEWCEPQNSAEMSGMT